MTRRLAGMLVALMMTMTACTADDDWTQGYEPCVTEDATGPCYWDASERGNGLGTSFVVTYDGTVLYRNGGVSQR